jgi:hypothetical protein
VDVGLRLGKAYGLGVGDEVHLMAALGELESELGRDDAAAAIRGVTGYANPHDVRAPQAKSWRPHFLELRRLDGLAAEGIQQHVSAGERFEHVKHVEDGRRRGF